MNNTVLTATLWGGLAAISLLIGFALSGRGLSNRSIGIIMGIGAGALISAIAYELVPESKLVGPGIFLAFGLGALAFFVGDWVVDRRGGADRKDIAGEGTGGSGAAIFIGTLLDNVPESIILGMSLALGGTINLAFLAAVFVSNLPEGAAGSVNLQASGRSRRDDILDVGSAGDHLCPVRWSGIHGYALATRCRWSDSTGIRSRRDADHAG